MRKLAAAALWYGTGDLIAHLAAELEGMDVRSTEFLKLRIAVVATWPAFVGFVLLGEGIWLVRRVTGWEEQPD